MEYGILQNIVAKLQCQDESVNIFSQNNVDLTNFIDPYHYIIGLLMKEIYGEEGYNWFIWYCYENDYGNGGLEAWDDDKNRICYDLKSLHQHLESLKNEQ